ncbi:hypothetical protein CWC28_12975 [Pseudoalteromonas sp. S4492]|uniref:Uncharacterized protein n=1 Tax=Pseudoalteromonas gelatinilytica TaxID=1703256 RepID=A0A3A3ENA7_9GAMM|nr:hypothetical protein D4741_13540 [Pseudoalteromonas profundi]TMO26742.1 hypothetical protein CWC28_12975 [Pseudoalteromonas sp. S4492]
MFYQKCFLEPRGCNPKCMGAKNNYSRAKNQFHSVPIHLKLNLAIVDAIIQLLWWHFIDAKIMKNTI